MIHSKAASPPKMPVSAKSARMSGKRERKK
jgi:hypothetical protein